MIEDLPEGVHTDTEAFIEHIRDHQDGEEGLAEYLELLYEDFYEGDLTRERHYTVAGSEHGGNVNIGRIVDVAVYFGMVWERDDPWEADEDDAE